MYDSDDFWMFCYVVVVCFQHLLVTLLLANLMIGRIHSCCQYHL